jgi:hypothetical protein
MSDSCSVYSGDDRKKVVVGGQERDRKKKERNVLGKRAGQASEPVKILHILHSTTHYTSNIEDIETKQIALSFTYPNSMFA